MPRRAVHAPIDVRGTLPKCHANATTHTITPAANVPITHPSDADIPGGRRPFASTTKYCNPAKSITTQHPSQIACRNSQSIVSPRRPSASQYSLLGRFTEAFDATRVMNIAPTTIPGTTNPPATAHPMCPDRDIHPSARPAPLKCVATRSGNAADDVTTYATNAA